jgi:hypothetical protein
LSVAELPDLDRTVAKVNSSSPAVSGGNPPKNCPSSPSSEACQSSLEQPGVGRGCWPSVEAFRAVFSSAVHPPFVRQYHQLPRHFRAPQQPLQSPDPAANSREMDHRMPSQRVRLEVGKRAGFHGDLVTAEPPSSVLKLRINCPFFHPLRFGIEGAMSGWVVALRKMPCCRSAVHSLPISLT